VKEKIDPTIAIIVGRPQRNPLFLSRASQVILGKVRAIYGRRGVGTHDGKRTVVALSPQHVGRSQTSGASAHNHDRAWPLCSTPGSRWWNLLTNKNLVAQFFHSPTRNRIKSRCPQRFAIPETETGMMPGTAHGIVYDQTFCERATVMCAVGGNGKEFITAADQNQFFAVGLARYHAAIAEIANRNSSSEIGFVCL
jgi:hypothetical protein